MFKRNWIAAAAFGLVFASGALAQEPQQSAAESEPESTSQHQENTPTRQDNPSPEPDYATRLLPAIQGIESAIRELVTDEGKIAAEEDRRRDQSDLQAQESMALWAFWMFIAAVASVVLTSIGVVMIWRTLLYTRDAAIHAGRAVDEAKHATAAAQETNRVTQEIGIKQTRANIAYLDYEINDSSHMSYTDDTAVRLVFKNFGQSPARDVCFDIMNPDELIWSGIADSRGNQPPPTFRDFSFSKVRGKTLLFCGSGANVKSHSYLIEKKKIIENRSIVPKRFFYIAGWIRYKDEFWKSDSDYRFCKFCIIIKTLM